MAASANRILTLKASVGQIAALLKHPNFAIATDLSFQGEIPMYNGVMFRFKSGVSFSSWGEDISITVIAYDSETVNVTVNSECAMPTQIIDWGKNNKNVNNICNYIQGNLAGYAPMNSFPQPVTPYAPVVQPAQGYSQYPRQPQGYNQYPQQVQYQGYQQNPAPANGYGYPQPQAEGNVQPVAPTVCRSCGATLPENAQVCSFCGTQK